MNAKRLAGLVLLVIAASCSDTTAPIKQITDLAVARKQWQEQNLHTYAFTLQRSCFCINVHPLQVVVLDDTVAGVLDLTTGTAVDRQLGETVGDLFAFIQGAIDNHAYLIRAEYDAAKGFPTAIDYDGDAQAADDEVSFRASDVHPIAPPP
jgi:hypothetical protein